MVSDEVQKFIENTIETSIVGLTARERFNDVKIQMGIFRGDALSKLLYE